LRPHLHETFSFEIRFILRHVTVKLFRLTVPQIFMIYRPTFHLAKFCKLSYHLKFCKVTPFRVQGWITMGSLQTHSHVETARRPENSSYLGFGRERLHANSYHRMN